MEEGAGASGTYSTVAYKDFSHRLQKVRQHLLNSVGTHIVRTHMQAKHSHTKTQVNISLGVETIPLLSNVLVIPRNLSSTQPLGKPPSCRALFFPVT